MGKQKTKTTTFFEENRIFFWGEEVEKRAFFLSFVDVFRLFGVVVLEGWQEKFLGKLWRTAFFGFICLSFSAA